MATSLLCLLAVRKLACSNKKLPAAQSKLLSTIDTPLWLAYGARGFERKTVKQLEPHYSQSNSQSKGGKLIESGGPGEGFKLLYLFSESSAVQSQST